MADLAAKKANFISRYKTNVTELLNIVTELKELRTEWDSQGYSSAIVDGDFTGDNNHLTAANLASAITSIQAITDLLAANGNAHYTNLYRVVR